MKFIFDFMYFISFKIFLEQLKAFEDEFDKYIYLIVHSLTYTFYSTFF